MDKIMAIKVVGCRFFNLLFILLDFWANFGQHDQIWANIEPNWPKNDRNKKSVYTSSKTHVSSHKNFQQFVSVCMHVSCVHACMRAWAINLYLYFSYMKIFCHLHPALLPVTDSQKESNSLVQ